MLARALGPDNRVRTTQLKMRPCSTIAIAKHVKYGNTAPEMLRGRFCVTTHHVQHSIEPVSFAREIQISGSISRLGSDALKFPIAVFHFMLVQVGFGSDQP